MTARGIVSVALALVLAAGAGYLGARYVETSRRAPRTEPAPELAAAPSFPIGERIPVEGAEAAEEQRDAGADGWNRRNNEGVELLAAGDVDRAIEIFRECLEADPEKDVFRTNLAEALARRATRLRERARDDDAALAELARAVEIDPARADLASLLARWREEAEVERHFWRADGYAFELTYDPQRVEIDRYAPILLSKLELAYDDLRLEFGADPVADGRPRIRVGLYTREEFQRLTGLGHWAGGVYDGTVRVPVDDIAREDSQLDRVLRHELSHHFTREIGGSDVPGWLDEGLAQWNEGRDPARVADARALLSAEGVVPLERMRGSLASVGDERAIHRAYAQALALVDYVAHSAWGGELLLFELVRGCGEGKAPEQTFAEEAGFPLDEAFAYLVQEL